MRLPSSLFRTALVAILLMLLAVSGSYAASVVNTLDSGPGSLRQAIIDANGSGPGASISFNIPGTAPFVIQPLSPLPAITAPMTIDGTTQPGTTAGVLMTIVIDGSLISPSSLPTGLTITGGGTTVNSIAVEGFTYNIDLSTGSGNTIVGCFLGTDATGKVASPVATEADVRIFNGSGSNTIGGIFTQDDRNLISGAAYGVLIGLSGEAAGSGNEVRNAWIGTDSTGERALPNSIGVGVEFGTNTTLLTNLISGNSVGVQVATGNSGTVLQSNLIGIDRSETVALGNTSDGVEVAGACSIIGNTISGNAQHSSTVGYGLTVAGDSNGHSVVQGNKIGTAPAGLIAIPNAGGVLITGSGDVIGGSTSGQGNVISGNNSIAGIDIEGSGATSATIQGNDIGVGIDGVSPIGNASAIRVAPPVSEPSEVPTNIMIGGESAGQGNIIAYSQGIMTVGGTGISILGNSIYNIRSSPGIGFNGFFGVIANSPENSSPPQNFPVLTGPLVPEIATAIVGQRSATPSSWSMPGVSPRVALSATTKVSTPASNPVSVTNRRIAFAPVQGGMLPNLLPALPVAQSPTNSLVQLVAPDDGQADSQFSNWATAPAAPDLSPKAHSVLLKPQLTSYTATVTGTLNSKPNANYNVEIFANHALNSLGNGDGETYLGSVTVPTDGTGNGNFSKSVTVPDNTELYFTATATDSLGNTSEFSAPAPSNQPPVPGPADITIANGPTSGPGQPRVGDHETISFLVTNNGPNVATNVVVTTVPPAQGFIVTGGTLSQGSMNPDANALIWSVGSLNPNTSAFETIDIVDTVAGANIVSSTVTEANVDPNIGNNSADGDVNVGTVGPDGTADLSVEAVNDAYQVSSGQSTSFDTFTINNGPADATNAVLTVTLSSNVNIQTVTPLGGGTPVVSGNTITVTYPTIPASSGPELNITGTVTDSNPVTMNATLTSDTPDSNLLNNNNTSIETPGVGPKTYVVTNTNDSGAGSLREALTQTSTSPFANTIDFDIPGTGPFTITPQGDLPGQFSAVTIDGYSQPGSSPNTLVNGDNAVIMITLDGSLSGEPSAGLTFLGDGATVKGLCINRNLGQLLQNQTSVDPTNAGSGILIEASGITVQGCFIGTDASGTSALGNQVCGIGVFGDNATIGGPNPADRNVIAANAANIGVASNTTGTVIENNYLGTDHTGARGLPDASPMINNFTFANSGVVLSGIGTTVGGSTSTLANVISGNTNYGVEIESTQSNSPGGNTVIGNLIGLDPTGSLAVPNGEGVLCSFNGTGNVVGGSAPGTGNIISGNSTSGVTVWYSGTSITGNFIGTDVTGSTAVPNGQGVVLAAPNVVVGGGAGAGNLISGNSDNGVSVLLNAASSSIQGNTIGLTAGGSALPNGGSGVHILGSSTVSVTGNTIADNQGPGISVVLNGTNNTFMGNSIYGNQGLGIDLGLDGVTQNHLGGGTFGNNNLQNFPVLTSAVTSSGSTTFTGTINTDANENVTIEFFASPTADQSGYGQGKTSLGTTVVTTNSLGNGTINYTALTPPQDGAIFSATATGASGATSEFSADQGLTAPVLVDTAITMTASAPTMALGSPITYTLSVTNNGPNPASGVTVTDLLPTGLSFISGTATQGSVANASGTVTATIGSLAMGAHVTITIVAGTSLAGPVTNTATVTQTQSDSNTANNTASAATDVVDELSGSDLGVAIVRDIAAPNTSQQVTYTVTVTNYGPKTATNIVSTNAADVLGQTGTGTQYVDITSATGQSSFSNGVGTFKLGSLASGQSATYQMTVEPQDAGTLQDTATVAADQFDPVLANNTAVDTTTIAARPSVQLLVMGGVESFPPVVGTPVVVTVSSQNTIGVDTPATGVVLTYTIPANCTFVSADQPIANQIGNTLYFDVGTLNPTYLNNASGYVVDITIIPQVAGFYSSAATTYGNEAQTVPSDLTTDVAFVAIIAPYADLQVTGDVSPVTTASGTNLLYTVTVTNLGTSDATNVNVVQTMPPGATYVSSSVSPIATPTANAPQNTADYSIGTIANGDSVTLTSTVALGSTGYAGQQVGIFSASALTIDPIQANNTLVLIAQMPTDSSVADLAVSSSGPGGTIKAQSGAYPYTITVTNNGPSNATGVVLTATLSPGLTYSSSSPSCSSNDGTHIVFDLGPLANGASQTITLYAIAASPGMYKIVSTVFAGQTDNTIGNNTSNLNITATGTASADVSVSETGPPAVLSGGAIAYTIHVTNSGPDTASGIVVTDMLPANFTLSSTVPAATTNYFGTLTFDVGSLIMGASETITINGNANNSAPVSNPVTVTEVEPDPNLGNNNAVAVTQIDASPSADLAVAVVAPANIASGASLAYTVTVTNLGPSTATGVVLTDHLPSDVTFVSSVPSTASILGSVLTFDLGSIAVGTPVTVTVTTTAGTPGSASNTVSIAGTLPDLQTSNNSATTTTTITGTPTVTDLSITQIAPANVISGNSLDYSLTVTNTGPGAASGVVVADSLPSGTTFVSAVPTPISNNNGVLVFNVGALANGATAPITVNTTSGAPATVVNTVSVTGNETDTNTVNNSSTGATVISAGAGSADLGVTVSGPTLALSTANVVYQATVSNAGGNTASAPILTATVSGFSFVSATISQGGASATAITPTMSDGMLTFALPNMPAAPNANSNIVVMITESPGLAGSGATSLAVSSDVTDPNQVNNSASIETTVGPAGADLGMTVSGPTFALTGTDVTYVLTATNFGNTTSFVTLLEGTMPAGFSFVSATVSHGGATPVTLSPTITGQTIFGIVPNLTVAPDIDSQDVFTFVLNPGTASSGTTTFVIGSETTDPNLANNTASITTTFGSSESDLSISNSAAASVLAGGALAYTITATNNGPDDATNVIVTDPIPSNATFVNSVPAPTSNVGGVLTFNLGSIANGASQMITINTTAGSTSPISNTATLAADQTDPNTDNNSSTATTTVTQPSADIAITNTAAATVVTGGSLTYTLKVTNNGPDPATNVTIADTLPAGVTFASASVTPTSNVSGALTFNIGSLAANASDTITVTVTAGSPADISNTATVTADQTDSDSTNNSATANATINTGPTITISPSSLANGTVGAAYSQQFTGSGGMSPYIDWSSGLTAGVVIGKSPHTPPPSGLPAGMSLTSGGLLHGTPTAGGTFNFTVTTTDSSPSPGPYQGSRNYMLTIGPATISLSPGSPLATGTEGTNYSQSISASGGTAPYTLAVTSGSLPDGLTMSSSGVISGVPTANGPFNFTVTATDSSTGTGPFTGSKAYTISVILPQADAPTFSLPSGTYNTTQTVTILGTTPNETIYYTTDDTMPTVSSPTFSGAITVSTTEIIQAFVTAPGYTPSAVSTAAYTILPIAPTPVISPNGGTFDGSVPVTVTDSLSGATILYTIDGTNPATSATAVTYAGQFVVNGSATVKAVAKKTGYANSALASAVFTIVPIAPAPVISPDGGTFDGSVSVSITDSLGGATILYTTDGSDPATSGTAVTYSAALTLNAPVVINAIAKATGYANSPEASAGFTIVPIAPAPTISPNGGTFDGSATVTLSDSLAGATIFYTTDGSNPVTSSTAHTLPPPGGAAGSTSTYTAPFTLTANATVTAIATATGYANSPSTSAMFTIVPIAPAPSISPNGGTSNGSASVTLTDTLAGATILYTTDGSDPATSATALTYSAPFTLSSTATVTAIAEASGYANSPSAVATFTVVPIAPAPTISPDGGTSNGSASVTLADTLAGASILYTTDGSDPTTSATASTYAAPFTLIATATISAVAEASGYANSPIATAQFTIVPIAPAPAISPDGGSFDGSVSVTLSDTLNGATILYTTDGTNPATSGTAVTYSAPFSLTTSATVTAVATATGYANSPTATAVFTILTPSISITASGPQQVQVSQTVSYTVTVANTGTADATGATLTDTIPAGYSFVSATISQGGAAAVPITPSLSAGIATFSLPVLPAPPNANSTVVLDIVETTLSTAGAATSTFAATAPGSSNSGPSTATVTTTNTGNPGDGTDVTSETTRLLGSMTLTGDYLQLLHGGKVTFTQTAKITNTTGSAIDGPVLLVVDNLKNAELMNLNGVTTTDSPLGSPYVIVSLGAGDSLAAGASVIVTLEFLSSDPGGISYTTRVLAGSTTISPLPEVHDFPAGLQMISAPYDYASIGVDFAQLLGTADPKVAIYTPLSGSYALASAFPADTMRLGQGYWTRLGVSTELSITAPDAPEGVPFSEYLPAGWNQIGDPYATAFALSSLQVSTGNGSTSTWADAVASGLVNGTVYAYDAASNSYVSLTAGASLQPFVGYWILVNDGCTLVFPH